MNTLFKTVFVLFCSIIDVELSASYGLNHRSLFHHRNKGRSRRRLVLPAVKILKEQDDDFWIVANKSDEFKLARAVVGQRRDEIERLIMNGADPVKQPREGGSSAEKLAQRPPFESMISVINAALRKREQELNEAAESKED